MSVRSGTNVIEPMLFAPGGGGTLAVAAVSSPILEVNEAGGLCQLISANLLTNDIAFTVSKISAGVNGIQANCPAGWTVNGVLNTALILPGSQVAQRGGWLYYTKIRLLQIVVLPAV